MEPIDILIDDLSNPKVIEFLNDHLRHMVEITPPGCVHALDVEALKKPEITFWTVWERSVLVCCGALKELDATHAELKSMRTAPSHQGKALLPVCWSTFLPRLKRKDISASVWKPAHMMRFFRPGISMKNSVLTIVSRFQIMMKTPIAYL